MEFRDQVKSAVDIVNVIGKYVRLKKAGPTRYQGLCPFHQEKTPSFSVHATHQFYKCFGCGEGGDVFAFLMKVDGLTFYEALTRLAEENNIPVPKRGDQPDPDTKLKAALYSMHEIAAEMFASNLQGPNGKDAMSYLRKRGVSPTAASEFGLGLSDGAGQTLVRRLLQAGFQKEDIAVSGLAGQREDGSLYDFFRNRLMFPIHNEAGKLVAFGGRALSAEERAKYMNSGESLLYTKSRLLYNLNRAKDSIRRADQAIIVEGYMDVIGVADAGVREVTGVCGTALTSEQVRLLKRHSPRVVINFDSDAAGADSTEKRAQTLLAEGMHVRVLQLSDNLDPDEFVQRFGIDAYREALKKAPRFFDWLADRARQKFDFRNPEDRVEGFRFLVPTIRKIPDKLERISIAKDLAATLGVEEKVVRDHFRDEGRGARFAPPREEPNKPRGRDVQLIFALMNSEQARQEIVPRLRELDIVDELSIKQILRALFDLSELGEIVSYHAIEARLDDDSKNVLASLALTEEEPDEELALARARDCLKQLELENRELYVKRMRAEILKAERSGNLADALRLNRELQEWERSEGRSR